MRVALPNGMSKGQEATLTFDYEGIVTSADDSPVPGLKLAYVGDPISYLLYSGRWFPVTNFGIDRFTARVKISVPAGYTVVSSGSLGGDETAAAPAAGEAAKANVDIAEPAPKLQRRDKTGQGKAGQKAKAAAAGDKSAGRSPRTKAAAQSGAQAESKSEAGMKTVPLRLEQAGLSGDGGDWKVRRYSGERSGNDRARVLSAG